MHRLGAARVLLCVVRAGVNSGRYWRGVDTRSITRNTLAGMVFDDAPLTSLTAVLWQAAAADIAILLTGVAIGFFVSRRFR